MVKMVRNILEQPTVEQQIEIRKSFNEDLKTRDAHLEAIKEWLRKQPHLPDEWDEHRIMIFLRGCNFSLEKTKKKLDMYFTMRAGCPEFFTNRDPFDPELQRIMRMGCTPALPQVTPDGCRVTCITVPDVNVKVPKFEDVFKLALMMADIRLHAEECGVRGELFVVDCRVANWQNFQQVNPLTVKKFFVIIQEAYPAKIKGVHLVNASPIVHTIISVFKQVVKEKIRNRIFIHSTLEDLHKHIPKDILPKEFDGDNKEIQYFHDLWLDYMGEFADWFKEQENIKADETKRPGKPTNFVDLFGVEGSFKKLDID